MVGLILVYNLRVFERLMGSRKFASALLLNSVLSSLLSIGLLTIASSLDIEVGLVPSPGPFFLIYSLIPLFYRNYLLILITIYLFLF